jgi:hypothetical protein
MRRLSFMLTLLGVMVLASSAFAQDTTARQDTTHHPLHKRIPATSRGDVDTSRHKPPAAEDTAKIHAPSRRDSALVRRELRTDTASVARDTIVRPHAPPDSAKKPPPDTLPKKPPPA